MSTSSSAKSVRGAIRRRAGLSLGAVVLALLACGAMASSALALSWWVEVPPTEELALGKKLYLGSAAKVNSPFTLKWKKKFEISCGGEVTYNSLYLEGHLGIGAEGGIDFGKCTAKKPKGMTLIGEKVETLPLAGTVTQSGSKYLFTLAPKTSVVASFQLERTVKPRKHYKAAKNKLCKYNVEAVGKLEGELGDKPEKISTEKTLDFASHELTMKSTKSCENVMDAVPAARKPLGASALALTTKGQGALPSGAPLEAISHNAILETASGNLECEENLFAGPLTSNNGKADNWQVAAALAQGNFEGIPGACKTSATGPAQVQWSGLPWSAAFSSKGTIQIKSKQGIEVTASFLAAEGASCAFVAPQLAGVTNATGPVSITFSKQTFKLAKGGAASFCPQSGAFSGNFTLTSSGEPVEAEAAVSEKEQHEESEEAEEETEEVAEEEAGLPVEGNKGKLGYSGTEGWGLL